MITLNLRTWTASDHVAMDEEIVRRRGDPLLKAAAECEAAPAEQQDSIWQAAFEATRTVKLVTKADRIAFGLTLDGIAWSLWVSVRRDHPEITSPDDAKEIVVAMGPDRLHELMGMISTARGFMGA